LGPELANKLQPGILNVTQTVAHAGAYIEEQSDVERNLFIAEEGDLLADVVLVEVEIPLCKLRDEPARAVADEKRKAD